MLAGELLRSCMDASMVERIEWGVPALEVESFVGDKDLARSGKSISTGQFAGIRVSCSTISSCLPPLTALQDFFLQFTSTLLIFFVPSVS